MLNIKIVFPILGACKGFLKTNKPRGYNFRLNFYLGNAGEFRFTMYFLP